MLIAIAGGAGVGKSFVCEIIEEKGFLVFDVDKINRDLFNTSSYKQNLLRLFPEAIVNNRINKDIISKMIFDDPIKRAQLEALSHPAIIEQIIKLKSLDGINFIQIPLLISSNTRFLFDKIWAVYATKEERLNRIISRNSFITEYAEKIIIAQALEEQVYAIADSIINNSNNSKIEDDINRLLDSLC
ncbi:MAG: dephospho-CoA kinase [Christensenellaceae bacterium]|jgi:dephospho-CoA kinase|nr:dephospho-CoA kinase [Christensenellaceae bacterium]